MQIRKKWFNLTNWKKILTNILKNIIWHLFAGEFHQDVKITVAYCLGLPKLSNQIETKQQKCSKIRKEKSWKTDLFSQHLQKQTWKKTAHPTKNPKSLKSQYPNYADLKYEANPSLHCLTLKT